VPYINGAGGGAATAVGVSVLIPQQTVSGGSGQLTLGAATWDTSSFLNSAANELDFPDGESGVYVWGGELYVTQPAAAGAYMNFQVKTNGAPVNLQATLPLVGTGVSTGAGIASVGSFVGGTDGVYLQANNAGFVNEVVLNGVLFLYKVG